MHLRALLVQFETAVKIEFKKMCEGKEFMQSLPKVQFHSLHMNKSNVIASNIQTIIKNDSHGMLQFGSSTKARL